MCSRFPHLKSKALGAFAVIGEFKTNIVSSQRFGVLQHDAVARAFLDERPEC